MAAKTKAALSAEQAAVYADNFLGQITAKSQRGITQDLIDSSCTLQDDNLFASQTDSSSPITGSLVLTGGLGVGKSMWVGGTLYGFNYTGPAALTGIATAPTVTFGDNSANIATTAFVANAIVASGALTPSNVTPTMNGTGAPGVAVAYSRGDHVHPTDTSRAPINNANLTGTPTAPTPAQNDNTTKLATTGFVLNQAYALNPAMNGTASAGVNTLFSRGDHVHPTDTSRAPTANPTFTGTATFSAATFSGTVALNGSATALTVATADNSTNIATTAFVKNQAYATLASPTFTGTPAAPTPAVGTNTTQLATAAMVTGAIANLTVRVTSWGAAGTATYTPNAHLIFAMMECVGGGGGGGGVAGAANFTIGGSGGGSGGYSRKIASAAAIGASQTVTVGAGGVAGGAGASGGSGGTSSVGALCTAGGGGGGGGTTSAAYSGPGAPGGTGSGDVSFSGGWGTAGTYVSSSTISMIAVGGAGASSVFGGSGLGPGAGGTASNGGGGLAPGAGGGGASTNVAANAIGGAGATGVVIITEYCSA